MKPLKQNGKLIITALIGIGIGMAVQRTMWTSSRQISPASSPEDSPANRETWTCSMHPQIKLPQKGKCPICFMDLIPLEAGNPKDGPRNISISPDAAKLMELETATATRTFVDTDIRLTGKVDYDETRVSVISAWVPGRLDRLFINYTGIPVKKGDHMAEIYSPDLLTAQEELIQASKTLENLTQSESAIVRQTAASTIEASREKLRLLGLNGDQIRQIETSQKATDHITLYAPNQGIVIHKNAREGMYVATGTPIYTIADFSTLWVKLDAYESDLQSIRYGAKVDFTTETYPGRTFSGTVSFVDPIISPDTRTAKVRVQVANPDLALKPGMFVRALLRARMAEGGLIINNNLAGKWISPMHPEIIKDKPGTCDICDMPLVSAESLGYAPADEHKPPLIIPAAAALKTGKRAVVYRQIPEGDSHTYEGVEVVLGPRIGDFYVIESGLQENDRIVTRGNFKLDAELQIQAKTSMMSETGDHAASQHHHLPQPPAPEPTAELPDVFTQQLRGVVNGYLTIQKALAADNPKSVRQAAMETQTALNKVDINILNKDIHTMWMPHQSNMQTALTALAKHTTLTRQREAFAQLSSQIVRTLKTFPVKSLNLYRASCSMAFDNKGAFWLQDSDRIANPYFGHMMLRCGSIKPFTDASGTGGEHD